MNHFPELVALLQIILIDLSMAGDNALVIGMAAAGLPTDKRRKAVMAGIVGATVLRIVFAVFAVQILHITGLLAAGGLLLLWVGWKMWQELRHARVVRKLSGVIPDTAPQRSDRESIVRNSKHESHASHGHAMMDSRSPPEAASGMTTKSAFTKQKTLSSAIWQIIMADVSMSLDNVLGVAGVARDHVPMLVVGLGLSVLLMGATSTFIARLAAKHNWVGYLGLAVILYTAVRMVVDGAKPFLLP